jgi:hypothetical protein
MMTNLQTITSFFWSDPRVYNIVAYLICGPLILLWIWITLRTQVTPLKTWLALASISALSLLPLYHRQYDAKLIMLQFPAVGLLLTQRHPSRRLASALTAVATFLTGDLPWLVLLKIGDALRAVGSPLSKLAAEVLLNFSVPLALLATGVFYLWLYMRQTKADHIEPLSTPGA